MCYKDGDRPRKATAAETVPAKKAARRPSGYVYAAVIIVFILAAIGMKLTAPAEVQAGRPAVSPLQEALNRAEVLCRDHSRYYAVQIDRNGPDETEIIPAGSC